MSFDRELTGIVQSWLRDGEDILPERVLDDVLGQVPSTPQRLPLWRAWRKTLATGTFKFAVTGAVVLALVFIGFGLFRSNIGPVATPTTVLPTVAPTAPPSPTAPPPTQTPTAEPNQTATPLIVSGGPAPWIVFQMDGGGSGDLPADLSLWAMRADGSRAHKIQDGLDSNVAWSDDGTRLLANTSIQNPGHIVIAEVGDEIGTFVDTGIEVPVNGQWEAFDFAPDGERVVYVQKEKCATGSLTTGSTKSGVALAAIVAETVGANCVVLSVLDLRTGERTELGETLVKNQTQTQNMELELPAWSPDGTRIAYTRHDMSLADTRELWIVNADGTNPSRIEMEVDVSVQEPRWSPDGTRISFTSETSLSDNAPAQSTVYVVELATGGLERVSTGSNPATRNPCCAEWIDNARLRVQGDGYGFWVGTLGGVPGESRSLLDLTDSLAAIHGAGQIVTRYAPGNPGRTFLWQPVQEVQP